LSTADDEALVRRALEGDRTTQRKLAERLLGSIQREVAITLARAAGAHGRDSRQEVRDLVQEVLLALLERDAKELRRWDPARGRSLDSFVRLVARRRVARILGQRVGNPWAHAPTDPQDLDDADDQPLTRRLETRHELDGVLVALSAKMSARDQELFELLFVEDQDPEDVARRLQMSRAAVNAWSYRMRKLARAVALGFESERSSAAPSPTKKEVPHGG
jgi:RNA polymerase sigma factor (sigma-70 family)